MPADLQAIKKLEVPIIVQLAERSMTVGAVVSLAPGAIIELPKFAEEELDLLVNNKRIGAGVAVKVGENFGIRISYIGNVRERIKAMGPDGANGQAPAPDAATKPDGASATPASPAAPSGAGVNANAA